MIKANVSTLYLQADEIDHLTLRYTDYDEPLNRKTAINMISFYRDAYDDVAAALKLPALCRPVLEEMSEKELYDLLVIIRTVLLTSADGKR